MDIRKDIFQKYLEKAAIEQIASEYRQKGYKVVTKTKAKDLGADLIVQKGKETIVFEFKAGKWTEKKRQAVRQLRNRAVHDLDAKFKLVLVNLPEEPDIEIQNLERVFFGILPEYFKDEFNELATHS